MRFRRMVQALSFILFLTLLWLAAFPLISPVPVDTFLRMDPLILLGTGLAARTFIPALWPAIAISGLTLILGRFFCGFLCPLGTTIDMADHLIRRGGHSASPDENTPESDWHNRLKRIKYQVLMLILGAALFSVSFVFLVAPLSLITRFYGLLIYPALCFLSDMGLTVLRPVADYFNLTKLVYAQIDIHRFDFQWFIVGLFGAIFICAYTAPRFWCRYLCPAGAIFALFSSRPLIRRQVSEECIECGKCQNHCPMNAIGSDPLITDHRECIACEKCVQVCPADAITFSRPSDAGHAIPFSPERRQLIRAGAAGAGMAMVSAISLPCRRNDSAPGQIHPPELIRPPGALPERDFLSRCVRCGECMKACPTNTLQPLGLVSGFPALFSPRITPRRGPCEPLCNICGQVCPTGAISPLTSSEKIWAKVGTAHVLRHKCLAWEFDRKCLVCDEVCPYNAIDLKVLPGQSAPVPFVNEHRCSGCGFCEHYCPVQATAAIVVEPMEALRLSGGSYRQKGQEIGLDLSIRRVGKKDGLPYGRKNETAEPLGEEATGLPPGFSE